MVSLGSVTVTPRVPLLVRSTGLGVVVMLVAVGGTLTLTVRWVGLPTVVLASVATARNVIVSPSEVGNAAVWLAVAEKAKVPLVVEVPNSVAVPGVAVGLALQ